MLIKHRGFAPVVNSSVFIAPTAVVVGRVQIGPKSRVMYGATLDSEGSRIEIGECTIVCENAVLRATTCGNVEHPVLVGSHVFTYYPNMAGSSTATPTIKKTQRQLMEDGAGKALTDFFFESETRIAPVQTLSSFLDEQDIPAIGFLKIDVEGDELAVLQGTAREHVFRIRQLVIEAHTPEIAQEIYAFLTRMGFKVVSDIGMASPAEISDIYAINAV